MQGGWAKNPARDFISISHAEIRHLHLRSGGALRTQRGTTGDHSQRLAGDGALRPGLDSGAWLPASAARVEMDIDCRDIRPTDAPCRLPGNEPKALPGAH